MSHKEHQTSREHQRVLQLAREYRRQGFEVTVQPNADDLPSTLVGCPIDLVAKGDDRVIAIEVRSRDTLTLNGSEDLRRMTDLIQQIPGWEFELVVTNPRKKAS